VRVDAGLYGSTADAAATAARLEAAGFDGAFTAELAHDPFLPLALATTTTRHIELGTGIAVAFARNPMTLAVLASDLHRLSQGRFILGLGSQIKPHITTRFSMPWSNPAPRMRELISAIRAIWATWNDGVPLRFRGEFYRHTLMTPMFEPGPSPVGDPRILLAAVGPGMTAVAAQVADGLVAHSFTTPAYFRDVTLPTVARGLAAAGRARDAFQITMPAFVATGRDDAELAANTRAVRKQLAFYGSTPAYRAVLEHHGWGSLGDELNRLSKLGEWDRMADAVDDDILATFAVIAEPMHVAAELLRRYGGLLDRVQLPTGTAGGPDSVWPAIIERIKAG
jgi:probable F420-dependent oxidoreductase